jgi:hypothetical protein
MVKAAIGVYVKGGCLLVVERAEALEAIARLLERDVVADDVSNGGAFADLSNLVFGNHRRASPVLAVSVQSGQCRLRLLLGKGRLSL